MPTAIEVSQEDAAEGGDLRLERRHQSS